MEVPVVELSKFSEMGMRELAEMAAVRINDR